MNKKLMAVAVAGALATPMAALAQTSTVQVYGLMNVEYGWVSQPDTTAGTGRSNVDALNSGASRIGFRGEEQLGGGLSAWFQCESDFRFNGGTTQTAGEWCDRNSALGMKGAFGNFYIGTWDSPSKKIGGFYRVGVNDVGWTGVTTMTQSNGGAWKGTVSDRNPHSVNYDTPNWGGFSASFQYTTLQTARGAPGTQVNLGNLESPSIASATITAPGVAVSQGPPVAVVLSQPSTTSVTLNATPTISNVVPTPKGRRVGLAAQYVGGPLVVYGTWAQADDDKSGGTNAFGADGGKDRYWSIGANYSFGAVKVALAYFDARIDVAGTAVNTAGAAIACWPCTVSGTQDRQSWHLSGEWNISGPHTLRAGYSHAGDVGGFGIAPSAANPNALDNGADLWQIGYQYSFSKRTRATIIYARMNNDSGGTYSLTGNTANTAAGGLKPGDDSGVFALQMEHTF